MSLNDWRTVFHEETEMMVARLQQRSAEHSRLKSTEVSPASATGRVDSADLSGNSGIGQELAHLTEFRNLAEQMAENILQRVANKAPTWADAAGIGAHADEPAAAVALRREAEADGALASERRRSRIRDLEAKLAAKRKEEKRAREELISKCQADSNLALQVQEQRLDEICSNAGAGGPKDEQAAELQREFQEHVARIYTNMAQTRDAVQRLKTRVEGMERIEGQQRKPLGAMQAVLSRAAPAGNGDPLSDLDGPLVDGIRHGELICKRMRRSLAGGA